MWNRPVFPTGDCLFYFGATEIKSASYLRRKKQITEDLVQKIQDAEKLTLFSSLDSQESGEACEHGKYSGIMMLLRDNPTDKGGVLGLSLVGEWPWCSIPT